MTCEREELENLIISFFDNGVTWRRARTFVLTYRRAIFGAEDVGLDFISTYKRRGSRPRLIQTVTSTVFELNGIEKKWKMFGNKIGMNVLHELGACADDKGGNDRKEEVIEGSIVWIPCVKP